VSIYAKLLEAAREMEPIAKTGRNSEEGYDYAEIGPIVTAARQALLSRGVVILPSVVKVWTVQPAHAGKGLRPVTHVKMAYTLYDTESAEFTTCYSAGQGADSGDKGVPKAMTSALKYLLIQLLLIPIGYDPEADASTDREVKRAKLERGGALVRTEAELRAIVEGPGEVLVPSPREVDPVKEEMRVFNMRSGLHGRGCATSRKKLLGEMLGRKVSKYGEVTREEWRAVNAELFRRMQVVVGTEMSDQEREALRSMESGASADARGEAEGNSEGPPAEPAPDTIQ
jgi:hypothetical protein